MSTYINDILAAVFFFPILAALLTMPYLIRQYRKYGSVPWFHTILVYLFVFYLLCCYFLVLLPLPEDHSAVVKYAAHPQLNPFNWVPQLISAVSLSPLHPSTWYKALINPIFYEQLFNVIMLVPLGMFTRYCFRLRWWQCWLLGLGVSLSFETLQITGIFGWYEHPYRLFDVDDLITNSVGALLGCLMISPMIKLLPDMRLVAEEAREVGVRASMTQRGVSYLVDITLLFVIVTVMQVVFLNVLPDSMAKDSSDVIAASMFAIIFLADVLVFAVIPALTKRQTAGQMLCKLAIVRPDGQLASWYQPAARYAILQVLGLLPFILPVIFGFFALSGTDAAANMGNVTVSDDEAFLDLAFFIAWIIFCAVLVIQFAVRVIAAAAKKKPLVMLNGLLSNTRVMTLEGARREQERHQVMDVADVVAWEKRIAEEGTPLSDLMDKAGEAVAQEVMNRVPDPKPVVIFAGTGNNGGDGWVAARVLARKGYRVSLVTSVAAEDVKAQPARDAALLTEQVKNEEKLPILILVKPKDDVVEHLLENCAAVVDAMLGTGFTGDSIREPYNTWITLANYYRFGEKKPLLGSASKHRLPRKRHRAPFALAVDTPSGLNAQTGAIAQPCFAADVTLTMLAYKPGLVMDRTTVYTGVNKLNRLGM